LLLQAGQLFDCWWGGWEWEWEGEGFIGRGEVCLDLLVKARLSSFSFASPSRRLETILSMRVRMDCISLQANIDYTLFANPQISISPIPNFSPSLPSQQSCFN
jgi:hypothetical protein